MSLVAEATQISKRLCRNSGRGQPVSPSSRKPQSDSSLIPVARGGVYFVLGTYVCAYLLTYFQVKVNAPGESAPMQGG
eukprot:scaffold92128_cov54-Phaeocystis_antarctica.AAC.1